MILLPIIPRPLQLMVNGTISSMAIAIGCMKKSLSFTQAYQWSPKGNYIAYYRFDESKVKEYQFTQFDNAYNKQYTL